MAHPAVDPRAAMAGVEREQLFEERPAEALHRGPDRQLQGAQAGGSCRAAKGARGEGGQAGQLGGELRREVREEPPFWAPVVPGGWPSARGASGRAAQIASLTSTISPTIALNRL